MNTVTPLPDGLSGGLEALRTLDLADEDGVPGRLHLGDAPVHRFWPDVAVLERMAPGAERGSVRELVGGAAGGSAAEQLRAARARIAASENDVHAWAHLPPAGDVAEDAPGVLGGLPIGVKDVVDVAGMPTGAGSAHFARRGPATVDAGAVAMLRGAGAVVVGKTATHEFAFGGTTPPTRNPHDLDRIPGGSSGGSAAAVAAGHVRLALGTDTGGSVRIPSSYCGTVGMVPSPGLLPTTGVVPLSWSLDRVGLITSTADDLALASFALGLVREVAEAVDVNGLRIGVPSTAFDDPIDTDVRIAVDSALRRLTDIGAEVRIVELPHDWSGVTVGMTLIVAESADLHRARRAEPERFGADVRAVLSLADEISAGDYVRAQRMRAVLRGEVLRALSGVDVLAMPTMPCVAPRWDEVGDGRVPVGDATVPMARAHLRYNILANLAALPCGTVPVGTDRRGLPIGLQWVAGPGRDDRVVAGIVATERMLASVAHPDERTYR